MLEANLEKVERYTHTGGSAALAIRVPSPDETKGSVPYVVKGAGELPLETVALLGGLYALTGAEIVTESDEGKRHSVIRKGQYGGQPVYFRETLSMYDEDHPVFEVSVVHEDGVLSTEALFAKRNPLLGAILDKYDPTDSPKYK